VLHAPDLGFEPLPESTWLVDVARGCAASPPPEPSAGYARRADEIRAAFMPLEDFRDAWGPARVLHHATELAGIAPTGPIPPYVSALAANEVQALAPVARQLRELDA
jgi:hypothetical protein